MTTIAHSKVNPVLTTSKSIVVKVPERYEQHRAKSYAMLRIPNDDGTYRQGFRLHCGKCNGFSEVTNEWWGSTKHITLKFERAGWIVNERTTNWCICPKCQVVKGHKLAQPQEDPIVKGNGIDTTTDTIARGTAAAARALANKEAETMTTPPAPSLKPAAVPTLSPEVKAKIRQVLDRVFDDAKGAYLIDGTTRYSDEVVAKEVDLPRAVVIAYRELAYGPLLSDPELDELRVLLLASQRTIEAELQRIEHDRVKLTTNLAQLVELKQRIDRAERRMAQL